MKKIFLIASVAILALSASESWAGCKRQSNIGGTCYTWNPGVENNCGTGCTYTYDADTKTVNITATGNNAKISEGKFGVTYYEGNQFPVPISNIVIDGPIATSTHSFYESGAVITGKDGVLTLNGIGWHSLGESTIGSDVVITENTKLAGIALYNATINGKIYCSLENCAEKLRESCTNHPEADIRARCLSQINSVLSNPNKFAQAPEGCSYLSAGGCKKCKSNNFKLNDGECDRIRYTPAEAAKVLRDDDTNVVTITFKIQ